MNLQPVIVAHGMHFELIEDPPWNVYRHIDANGTLWDVAQHADIREADAAIWQVFECHGQRSRVLTSKWGDNVGPLYHCDVRDLGTMLNATAEYIHTCYTACETTQMQLP